ncbi:MAG: SIR2 family protein [Deltaproteobacteria bacterium]|nr:SIR2 family protein [Deltaproteobacteria bacterium]
MLSEDPLRQVNLLMQCLNQDKKRIGILLGAGCPFSIKNDAGKPLIPDIKGLTEIVKSKICDGEKDVNWDNICKQLKEDGIDEYNIEDILSRVRGLRDYAGNGEVRGLSKVVLDELENKICQEIKACVSQKLPNKATPFHNLATWIGLIDRSEPIEIFTTNYDLLIEQAHEDLRVPFFDGFIGTCHPFFDPYSIELDKLPSRWARLWKIHGSINWRSDKVDGYLKVYRTDPEKGGDVVIHPSHLKYDQSRKMPYLAMMERLRRFLITSPSILIIIGYSFGDQHLNDVIVQSIQGSPSTAVFALMYGSLSNYENAISLAEERSNLSLIAEDGAIIGTKQFHWKELQEMPESELSKEIIEWKNDPLDETCFKAYVKLGDFQSFGMFLQEISGALD